MTLLQICSDLVRNIDYDKIVKLLDDKNTDFEIKRNIIINLCDELLYINIIEDIARGEDEELAFQAIRFLYMAEPENAVTIVDDILQAFDGKVSDRVKAAIMVKALSLQNNSTSEEINNFIQLCDQILNSEEGKNEDIVNSIFFSLSDVKREESITYILNSNKIDDSMKVFCVKEGLSVAEEMISKSANEATVNNDIMSKLNAILNESNITENTSVISNNMNDYTVTSSLEFSPKGYAVYRDGVPSERYNFFWHAGIISGRTINLPDPIIHIGGPDKLVDFCTYEEFLDGNSFMGYYRPETKLSDAQRENVVLTATKLTNYNIGYKIVHQIDYKATGSIVQPSDIELIRCDGVVEYCYEYNGIRISGGDSSWNISVNSAVNLAAHTFIFPETQAKNYMVNMLGDVDCDGAVTAEDANWVMKHAAQLTTFNSYMLFVADVNNDKIIDANDAQLILQYAAKIIKEFPWKSD